MLKVVITYADLGNSDYVPLIDMAFASARKFGYKTVLVTDAGATKETLMPWILAAQKKFIDSDDFDGNSVLFSPDCLINRPLEPVFDFDFDLGVTSGFNPDYPINNGVIYLKHQCKEKLSKLWGEMVARCLTYSPELQRWYGDQKAMHEIIREANDKPYGLNVKRLIASKYNASFNSDPKYHESNNLMAQSAYVLHFKGKRKAQMAEWWEKLCSQP